MLRVKTFAGIQELQAPLIKPDVSIKIGEDDGVISLAFNHHRAVRTY